MAINLIVINLNLFYFPSTISWRDRRELQNPIPVGETTTCCVDIRSGNKVETVTYRDQKSRILPSSAVALLTIKTSSSSSGACKARHCHLAGSPTARTQSPDHGDRIHLSGSMEPSERAESWNLQLRLRNGFAERRRRPDDFARTDFEGWIALHGPQRHRRSL